LQSPDKMYYFSQAYAHILAEFSSPLYYLTKLMILHADLSETT